MGNQQIVSVVLALILSFPSFTICQLPAYKPAFDISTLNRSSFPKHFVFGAASSAYQYEGGVHSRGKHIWDTFTHEQPWKIADGSNGDIALDSYHRYKEDLEMLESMGMDSYRMSIAWARILPKVLFEEFGEKVQNWITFNEPYMFTIGGYVNNGSLAPGRSSPWLTQFNSTHGDSSVEPYLVVHHILLAHAAVVKLYREKYKEKQKGQIGITHVADGRVPFTYSIEDRKATQRALDFTFGWFG